MTRPSGACTEQQRRDLRQRLDHQHARHDRRAGKMSLEVIFADGDVLDGDEPLAGLVLHHRIDERRGEPVAEPIDGLGDVQGHGKVSVSGSTAGGSAPARARGAGSRTARAYFLRRTAARLPSLRRDA